MSWSVSWYLIDDGVGQPELGCQLSMQLHSSSELLITFHNGQHHTELNKITGKSLIIYLAPQHMFSILSGQWKEITLSGMPLAIPVHQYTCYPAYNMMNRSIFSDPDINSHLSNTTNTCFLSYPVKIEWNAPSHSRPSIYMLSSI